MPVQDFSHFNLRAHRPLLDELRDFYVRIVGLHEGPRPPLNHYGYWLYAGSRAVLHLSEAKPKEVRPVGPIGTHDHNSFQCIDREQYAQLLQANGIPYRANQVPLTGDMQFFLHDPAGNGVELIFPA